MQVSKIFQKSSAPKRRSQNKAQMVNREIKTVKFLILKEEDDML